MKKYNHAFTIAFSVNSNFDGRSVPKEELIEALERRVRDLKSSGEIEEACGIAYDTYENDDFILKIISSHLTAQIHDDLYFLICEIKSDGYDTWAFIASMEQNFYFESTKIRNDLFEDGERELSQCIHRTLSDLGFTFCGDHINFTCTRG